MVQRILLNHYLARTAGMLSGARRASLMLLVMLLTSISAWAVDPWTAAGGTGGSGIAEDPYFVNMPAKDAATTIGNAATLTIPSGITSFKLYDDGGSSGNYSNQYTGYFVITAPTGYVLQITGDINIETNYDKLTVFDNGTASDPKLLDAVSGTLNNINVHSSDNVITVYFESDNSTNDTGLDLTVKVLDSKDLQAATISGLQNYYLWNNGSPIDINYTVKDAHNTTLTKNEHYTATIKKGGVAVNNVIDAGDYTLEITGKGNYSGTTTASFIVYKMLSSGSGTKANPYIISTVDDWMVFTIESNAATYWASGVYVKMAADIGTTQNPVTTMVGTEANIYQGIFDGAGHTLTVQYGTADARSCDMYVAPFSWTKNSTIKNLHVAGYIYTSNIKVAGIASQLSGDSKILNCRCSMIFDSTTNGVSGIANVYNGYSLSSGNAIISNCIFDGEFRYNGTSQNMGWYGLVNNSISAFKISNSLFAPAYMNIAKTQYTTTICSSIAPGSNTIDNCYYTQSLKVVQGTDTSGMSPAELAAALGPMWEVRNEGGVDKVLPIYNTNHLCGATITGLEPIYRYTGSEITLGSLGYTLTDLEGNELTLNTDYSVSLTCNGLAVDKVQTVGDYTITFTGTGSYSGTKEATFKVMAYPNGLSIDYDYSLGDDGYFYVNAPINSTANVDLTGETEGFTFKVYDNGGKNGKYNCGVTETVVMTAPTGYVLQVVGSATGQVYDQLCIYNGNSTSSPALYDQTPPSNIGTVISTGESMTIYYKTSNTLQSAGLDLTVKLINVNTNYDINIDNPTTGGEVNSNSPTAKVNSVVTLTAVPSNNYELEGITVIDGNSNSISVDGGKWYSNNTATFSMPGTAVTVTPTFNTKKSATDGLYINMPTNGIINATIPAGVTSFKLYDDGGASGIYSRICNGDMVLTAPTGYRFKLSGTICTEYPQDWSGGDQVYLNVYDGASDTDDMLISNKRCTVADVEEAIQTVYSTANTMRVRFNNSANSLNTNAYGLNLTVELINENAIYDVTVNNTEEHGIINSDKTTSKATEVITLTASTDNGYIVNSISVTDGSSQPVEVEGGAWYSYYAENKATFVMPNSNATVASTFTASKTAEAGLYINMEKTKPLNVAIPAGIESFKVYDNGGASGNYPANCRSTVVLTAPEGYQLKLTGTVATDAQHDNLMVYDGTDEDNNHILLNDFESTAAGVAKDIGTITSSGRSMRLYFWTNSDDNVAAGLDLKVKVVNSNTKHNITFDNSDAGGDASATMSEAAIDEAVALTLTPASAAYLPSGINITSSSPAKLAWTGSFSNTATMTMPYADVTIAPTFTNTWTAAGGLLAMIPRDGDASATIPAGVQSFKIYDHSGPTGNYGEHIIGSLTLTAPTGYKHQLTGSITTEHYYDDLTVRDVNANTYILDMISSTTDGEPLDIGTVTSSGETISLTFRTDWGQEYAGLDLTSTLLPIEYTITYDGLDGATLATANPTTYTIESDDFTLTNPTRDGYTFAGWTGTGLGAASTSVTVTKGNTGTRSYTATWTENIATLDEGATPLAELTAMNGKQTKVNFTRSGLTAGAYSTICLPYNFTASETCTFYKFDGVKKVGDDWVADISTTTGGTANTPYIFTTDATSVTFSNNAVVAASSYSDTDAKTTITDWTFQGTYSQISLPKTGEYDYGFAAGDGSTVAIGTFVHLKSGASAAPFRAYLKYTGSDDNWAKAPNRAGAANDAMPSRIIVRIVGADGGTTDIGTLDTRTGEISTGEWFDLNGRRLQGKPSVKGVYINNGKKVAIK